MLDETFVFLSKPHIGLAYRKTNETQRQYCNNSEIIQFIADSINNNTLNQGVKYSSPKAIKYIYKFNRGSNKKSVSVVINTEDYPLYVAEIESLNNYLKQNGFITHYNLKKINKLLDTPLALLTYTNTVNIQKGIKWCLLIINKHIIKW